MRFYELFYLYYAMFNMIDGLILVSHAPKRWYSACGILGVRQIGIRAIGYRELGFNMGKTFLLKPDYNQNSALNDPQRRFAPRARLGLINSISTASYVDNRQVGNTPLSFRGPDPDSDCSENFRVNAESLGCLN